MQPLVDVYIVYQLVKRLVTPFEETAAFKLGIIDQNGTVLRPKSTLKTAQERQAWTWLDILMNNIKRIFAKIPGGRSKFFGYAASYFMLREPVAKLREASGLSEQQLLERILGPQSNEYLIEASALMENDSDHPTSIEQLATKHGVAPSIIRAQLKKGIRVEREHTNKDDVAQRIAMDHLAELPDYYDRLERMEVEPLTEDAAPTVAAGNGAVAGIGVGPQGEPGVRPRTFAGCRIFEVDPTTFHKCRFGKKRYARYEHYVGTGPVGEEIKNYGRKYRKKGIILMDAQTGSMFYLRRPRE